MTDWPLALLWACWAGYWILAAAGCRRAARTEARSSRLAHLLLLASSYALLFLEPITTGVLATPILQATPITQPSSVLYGSGFALYGSGFALTACGLGLATWARVHIGRNWSGTVAIRSEQRLVESGPYAWIRHPIYSGLLLALAGSAIAIGTLAAVLAVTIAIVAFWRKIQIEEGWIDSAFGHEYADYRRRVGGLLPFRAMRISILESFTRARSALLQHEQLGRTIDRLRDEGQLSPDRARLLREQLPEEISESAYVLRNLGAHLAMGVVFAFDVVPLPLGTIGRVLWVVGNRAYETVRGSPERAAIHSLRVVLVAAIPWIGYGAYLLPLRSESAELTWILAHHISYQLHGMSYEEFLVTKPRAIQKAGSWLVPDASQRATRDG